MIGCVGAASECGGLEGWVQGNRACFYYSDDVRLTQAAAELFCQSAAPGGHLAAATSVSDTKALAAITANARRSMWMGGSAHGAERTWAWADGSAMTYTRWAEGEPGIGANCMSAAHEKSVDGASFVWSTSPCSLRKVFVCEAAPLRAAESSVVRRDVSREGPDDDATFRASEEDGRVFTTDAPDRSTDAPAPTASTTPPVPLPTSDEAGRIEDDDAVRTTDAPITEKKNDVDNLEAENDDQVFTTDAPRTVTTRVPTTTTLGFEPSFTCATNCGGSINHPGTEIVACYCDETCSIKGDCCADLHDVCTFDSRS